MAEVISWDWRQQLDLEKLGEVVRRVSGGSCDITPIDTGSDDYAVVITDHLVDRDEARHLYLYTEQRFEDEEDREAMRAYWRDLDAEAAR